MADFFVVIGVFAFFGLCVAFVHGCERIIGPDEASDLEIGTPEAVGPGEPAGAAEAVGTPR
jgi:hypothetical protein